MQFRRSWLLMAGLAAILHSTPVAAQLRATPFVSGLTHPVVFVQDPADATTQYIVQQEGIIRVVRNGTLQPTPFLNLTAVISSGGERGLLGLAFPPDFGASGRFFVDFTNPAGDIVVARFKRSAGNPLVADPATRFDFRWSTGNRFIVHQPNANHNGGNIVFGPDGFLYIGTGDGGSGDDPPNNAQTLSVLLGKLLRIDVSVPDADPAGFAIPANNPFAATNGAAPEIWDLGLRNPWRYSFDSPSRGGTGALVIGDVGQNLIEEVDYEPAGRGGRNYGWRNREGAHDHITTIPPTVLPLVDPIFEYPHPTGFSITGGFVYRGSALPLSFRGRYFFADFVSQRIWSIALTINPTTGNATASDLREHTAELGSHGVSTFGTDANGELYFTDYNAGTILRIESTAPAPGTVALLNIDVPGNGTSVGEPFVIAGWAIDLGATTSSGIDAVHVWAFPSTGAPAQFVGAAQLGVARPDVAQAFGGSQFASSGFGLIGRGLAPGAYQLVVFGLVHATGSFTVARSIQIRVVPTTLLAVDAPAGGATVNRPFFAGGWAIDRAALSGTGIDAVHVWGVPVTPGGPAVFLGVASFGNRPDIASIFGPQFRTSGFGLVLNPPTAGVWDLLFFPHSSVSGQFESAVVVRVTVR